MTRLQVRIHAALNASSARWYEGLASDLAAHAWSGLARIGIDAETYGVSRVVAGDPTAQRHGVALTGLAWAHPVRLDLFDATMRRRYGALGLQPPPETFSASAFEAALARAMVVLDTVAPVGAAVRSLVWSVTPLAVTGPDYDSGFSDPDVPLSIFIGAHAPEDEVPPIRLAEGVLHEAMHLQLSLIEDVAPLVVGGVFEHHSPWQNRPRPTQGLLHGLYVFRVVQDFLRAALAADALSPADHAHAQRRIKQIDADCAQLSALKTSIDLTPTGRGLVERLER
ncbi:aKG-HExxH-type peptide beta-hydroxylase [Caulobacter soli]|uniref:aKG-HExxH-type peptide beta-hydroxylase n=1 Tax=Caulobacter soli TaxID=2708539 RepID=UPI0013EA162A|nr:HEXXH motif-containing putative peptide modification protein [Caulobacter soli]